MFGLSSAVRLATGTCTTGFVSLTPQLGHTIGYEQAGDIGVHEQLLRIR
jgi:hypothetical protein